MTAHAPRLPFSLHALIAEAKRRARQRRLLVMVVALVLATGGIGLSAELSSRGPAPAGPATLLIPAADDFAHRAKWNLSCMPAKGDVPDPAAACAAIAAQPTVVTNPDQGRICLAPRTWTFTIYGRVDNKWVLRSVPVPCGQ